MLEGPPLGPGGGDITWPDQVAPRGRKASSTRKIKPQTSNLNYPCLKFMVKNKGPLQSSVVFPDWSSTKWSYATSDSSKAEVIAEIILSTTFWKLLSSCRTLLQPLARMIRKADMKGSTYNSLVDYKMLLFQQHIAEHQGLPKAEHKQAQSLVL